MLHIITLIFLVFCIRDVGWGEQPIVVVGKSEQTEVMPNPTLEMAIQNGLVQAVEKAVEGMMTPEDIKKNRETLSKEVYQKADTFIQSYTIAEKTPLPTGYQVSLEVMVDTQGIESRLTAFGLFRKEAPRLREVFVSVSGITSYQTYLQIERLFSEEAAVQTFSLFEIEPTLFTWRVMMTGETGRLADRLLSSDFGGLKARVTAANPERLEVVLAR
jgi:hypothetical protein